LALPLLAEEEFNSRSVKTTAYSDNMRVAALMNAGG